jgi:ABC-2 type transport system ATP-binding protein
MAPVLSVSGLTKRYGGVTAVNGISFEVNRHEIVGLLGPNGAGKTSTISMILGVLRPDEGGAAIDGFDVATQRSAALQRSNFGAVYAPLPGNMTVAQNLRVFGMIYGVPKLRARVEELIAEFGLEPFRNVKCGALSSGEQTRVGLAKAMLNRPGLLLLDEPTASLDPSTAQDIRAKIRAFADGNESGVLWTSHNMYEVQDVCDRVLFLSKGNILLSGRPRELTAQYGMATLEELFIRLARTGLEGDENSAEAAA